MTTPPIPDWQLKLKRAQSQFDALGESIERYVNSDAYGFEVTEPERSGDGHVWSSTLLLRVKEPPPLDDWATMIGDVIHNTRSALDVMVYQRATSPTRATAFPIYVAETQFNGRGRTAIDQLPDSHKALIEREQPYNRWKNDPASDPLAMLADLDNAGKHRVVPAAISWLGAGALGFAPPQDISSIRIATIGSHLPTEDGAPIAIFWLDVIGPNPKVDVETRKSFQVVFGEGSDRAVEKPVYQTLVGIADRVRTLVADFEREG